MTVERGDHIVPSFEEISGKTPQNSQCLETPKRNHPPKYYHQYLIKVCCFVYNRDIVNKWRGINFSRRLNKEPERVKQIQLKFISFQIEIEFEVV